MAIANATEAAQGHKEELTQMGEKVSVLNERLTQANENAQVWGDALHRSSLVPDWTIRAGVPLGLVAARSFWYAASMESNIQLGFAGESLTYLLGSNANSP